ncbi:MAG: FKBP-type peptidyl-prolyl cis-trans isomerase [Lachnospiraceae bacterium]|nr:FKBP-type peptidyl-prolyl cis-trans isomerase [Lachnospiraceae bacterium]
MYRMKNKKRIITIILSLTIPVMLLSGCGGEGKDNTSSSAKASSNNSSQGAGAYQSDAVKEALSVVTLGEYKGVSVRVPDQNSVTDEELAAFANNKILTGSNAYSKDETKTTVEADSFVNVDYQGLLDGVAFSGGTAKNVTVDVAGNSDALRGTGYIPGFTSGLVGAKVGETVDCPVTFPESYGNAELAGKAVIFRFTVNYICKKVTYDTVDDAYVKEHFGLEKASDFKSYVKEQYKLYYEQNKDYLIRAAVINTVIGNATINGSFSNDKKTEYVFLAVSDKEGLTLDQAGYSAYLSNYMKTYGYSDKDEFLAALGDEQMLKDFYMAYKAIDLCVDSAKVV